MNWIKLLFFLLPLQLLSEVDLNNDINDKDIYIVRLKNGDLISGNILEVSEDTTNGGSFRFKTAIGTTTIYVNEVNEITQNDSYRRHRHRAFIMPTAEPIGDDHFISNYMIALFYGGFGLYDIISVAGGTSLIPTVDRRDQISVLNVKATLYNVNWQDMKGGMSLAIGGNLAFVNDKNRFSHIYGNITFRGDRTDLTGMVFVKTGADDFYDLRFADRVYPATYINNSFGLGLGITTKFTERHDLFFVGELWNTNISAMTNTGLLAAIRLQNTTFSADFGLMFFTVPALFPVVNFYWTPFK